MEIGAYFAAFDHLGIEEAARRLAELGYSCVELSVHTGGRFDVQEMLRADSDLDLDDAVRTAIRNSKARGAFKRADKFLGSETLGSIF